MSAKKMPLIAANGRYVYHEKHGVVQVHIDYCWLLIKENNERIIDGQIFKEEENRFIQINPTEFIMNESWDTTPLFIRDPNKRSPYGYYGELQKGYEKAIHITGAVVRVRWGIVKSNRHINAEEQKEITFSSKKELDSYVLWVLEGDIFDNLKHPLIQEIKEGKQYCLQGKGTVKVTKVFDAPHRDKTICEVEDASGECHNIPFNCEDFYLLPIEKWNNPLEFLDESTNELALLPWVIQKESDVNVYWKPVDDAANYIVSLYKTREINDRIDIYHLKDYIVDRNECFLILNGLIGGNFIFKVSAEDRNGKIIAQSRGISNSFPVYLT